MKKEQSSALVHFVSESFELIEAIKDAKEDGKIRLFEWVKLINESGDVFKAVKDLQGVDMADVSENDIQAISRMIMDSIDKEVRFNVKDVANVLRIAKNTYQIISRERD